MKIFIQLLAAITLLSLTACSSQNVQQDQTEPETAISTDKQKPQESGVSTGTIDVPPMTTIKAGKDLNLVRTLEGGACKNDQQGVFGMFLLYADINDIERIKQNKGAQIFSTYDKTIEKFSLVALQKAVQETDFAVNPKIETDKSQQKIIRQLAKHFRIAVANTINSFQEETTLMIDVSPFTSSFILYTEGCELDRINPDLK